MKTIEAINNAKSKLISHDISDREARLLLAYSLSVRSEELPKFDEISDEQYSQFMQFVQQRCDGKPYAYIVGHKEFMGIDFKVDENVLIPRDDTETLVETVLDKCIKLSNNETSTLHILDMCTGSGCIAISIAMHLLQKGIFNFEIITVDNSEEALNVAIQNAKRILNENENRIEFVKSDLFEKIDSNNDYDIIVSNPPYIKTDVISTLQKEVKDNEPMMALDGGEDGLYFYRKISHKAKEYLKPNGLLAYEIGYDQAKEVSDILLKDNYTNIKVIKDLGGNDRVIVAHIFEESF